MATGIENGHQNHNDQSYNVHMTKMRQHIIRYSKHVKVRPITSEQFLRDQLVKDRKRHTRGNNRTV